MNEQEIISQVKQVAEAITRYSASSQPDSLVQCFSNSKDFMAFSSDGNARNFEEFKTLCTDFYSAVEKQEISTIQEVFHVVDNNVVISGWVGDINASFKNGEIMKMKNYAATFVFRRDNNEWKVIHSHESSLPNDIIKN